MPETDFDLLPPQRLAIAYAPRAVRGAFSLLLRLDARFGGIVGRASEPMIGQIKLAWWRDALLGDTAATPKGEPLLAEYTEYLHQIDLSVVERLLLAWETLLTEDRWPGEIIARSADLRGNALFDAYAKMAGSDADVHDLAAEWAVGDLCAQFGDRVQAVLPDSCVPVPAARLLRPLGILAMSVRGISGPRLVWHALTGR